MSDAVEPEPEYLLRLANARMPFGKYAGSLLIDLPEAYVVWFSRVGYPDGEIGELLAPACESRRTGWKACCARW